MEVFLVVIFALLYVFSLSITTKRLEKMFLLVMGAYWLAILIASITNPFNLYKVSATTYFYFVSGFTMLIMGYSLCHPGVKKNMTLLCDIERQIYWITKNLKGRLIFYVSLGTILYLTVTQWKVIVYQAGLGNLKVDVFDLVFENNHLLYFYYQMVLSPLFYLSCVLLSYLILCSKWNRRTLLLGLYILAFCFVGGKRGYFAIVFIYFFIVFLIQRYSNINFGNYRKLPIKSIILIASFVFLGATIMTTLSNGGTQASRDNVKDAAYSVAENTFVYRLGPIRAFDKSIEKGFVESSGGYLFGRATLGGAIDYYGSAILNYVGIHVKSARSIAMAPIQNNEIIIGKDRTWNFAYSAFYYFYYDFGYIGVVFFSFLFGMFVKWSIKLFENTGTLGSMILMCYLVNACLRIGGTWFNIQLYTQPAILLCLMLHFMEIKQRRYEVFKKS